MHAAPTFQMTISRYGAWRTVTVLLVVLSNAAVGSWAYRAWEFAPAHVAAVGTLLLVASLGALHQMWQLRPVHLRWDTQRWHLADEPVTDSTAAGGHVELAMDWGPWILLRFVPDNAVAWRRAVWLPVQRRGHEASWHALRCTVYCARPASLPDVAPF